LDVPALDRRKSLLGHDFRFFIVIHVWGSRYLGSILYKLWQCIMLVMCPCVLHQYIDYCHWWSNTFLQSCTGFTMLFSIYAPYLLILHCCIISISWCWMLFSIYIFILCCLLV
jgi:hypothetical protein